MFISFLKKIDNRTLGYCSDFVSNSFCIKFFPSVKLTIAYLPTKAYRE